MDKVELSASNRQILGKKVRFLRRRGITPANMYGQGLKSVPLQIETSHLQHVLAQAGKTSLIPLKIDGTKQHQTVMVRDIQRDPRSGALVHIDLYQIKMTDKITIDVPLQFVGEAPAVKERKGMFLHALNSLEVECLASSLPHSLEADISGLAEVDQALLVKDIPVPDGVTILTDPDQMVVKIIRYSRVEAAEEVPVAKVEVEAKEEQVVEGGE